MSPLEFSQIEANYAAVVSAGAAVAAVLVGSLTYLLMAVSARRDSLKKNGVNAIFLDKTADRSSLPRNCQSQ